LGEQGDKGEGVRAFPTEGQGSEKEEKEFDS